MATIVYGEGGAYTLIQNLHKKGCKCISLDLQNNLFQMILLGLHLIQHSIRLVVIQ